MLLLLVLEVVVVLVVLVLLKELVVFVRGNFEMVKSPNFFFGKSWNQPQTFILNMSVTGRRS